MLEHSGETRCLKPVDPQSKPCIFGLKISLFDNRGSSMWNSDDEGLCVDTAWFDCVRYRSTFSSFCWQRPIYPQGPFLFIHWVAISHWLEVPGNGLGIENKLVLKPFCYGDS